MSMVDPNGIGINWEYDAFGRKVREARPDLTSSLWQYYTCTPAICPNSNARMLLVETVYDTSGAFLTDRWIHIDRFDRPIAAKTRTVSGNFARVDREYDSLGRVRRQSAPCWDHSCTQYWTTFTYDPLGRVAQVQRPISDSNPSLQSSLTYYEGLTTRSVDALGKQSTHVGNVVGQLARSIDHDGHYQSFDYDPFGNSVRVTDSTGNVLMSNVYNVRGMPTSQTDMDMGTWTYTPNALGELVSQRDAKNQTTSFGYDLLGRLITRTEPEGVSTFTFGTSAAARNIGELASMSGPGYSESYTYDGARRLLRRTITSDATYQIDYAYNAIGALDTLTYPASTSGYRLKLQYDYNFGSLQGVRDFNAPSTAFWTADDTDARGAVISETLGNGVQTVRGFDTVTGLLDYIQSGPGGSSTLQSADYQWDLVGNLTQRSEGTIAKTQNFVYDNLHRLDNWTTVGGSTVDLTYDALGNITANSSVGTYTYDTTRKHRVLTAGSNTYAYDNNGNVTTKNGQPITWYSYNLPRLISGAGSNSSEFFYAPDRSRWKQVASYGGTAEQTIYIGGLIEKVTRGSVTSWKHYVSGANGAVAEVIRRSNGTNETVYLLKDHLGSTEVITNSSGAQVSRLAYGGLGARRNGATWAGAPSSAELTTITNTTRRGYTSHEMLDNLSLVHMNGRIYDPEIGRFLSADPFVQAPGFTQSFNRYSYAFNNPLKYTDPSGFSAADGVRCDFQCGRGASGDVFVSFSALTRMPGMPSFRGSFFPRDASWRLRTRIFNSARAASLIAWDKANVVADNFLPGKYYTDSAYAAVQEGDYLFGGLLYAGAVADVAMGGAGTRANAVLRTGMSAVTRASTVGAMRVAGSKVPYTTEIALGLTRKLKEGGSRLQSFADEVGAAQWGDWATVGLTKTDMLMADLFEAEFKAVVVETRRIHFDLSGMVLENLRKNPGNFNEINNMTNAELLWIVRHPELLKKTTFYREVGDEWVEVKTKDLLKEIN